MDRITFTLKHSPESVSRRFIRQNKLLSFTYKDTGHFREERGRSKTKLDINGIAHIKCFSNDHGAFKKDMFGINLFEGYEWLYNQRKENKRKDWVFYQ